jgi:hypothetical protein
MNDNEYFALSQYITTTAWLSEMDMLCLIFSCICTGVAHSAAPISAYS